MSDNCCGWLLLLPLLLLLMLLLLLLLLQQLQLLLLAAGCWLGVGVAWLSSTSLAGIYSFSYHSRTGERERKRE